MRVYLGQYVYWFRIQCIIDKLPFLSEETKNRIGDWLDDTWLGDIVSWYNNRKKRCIKVRIDEWDTWNMDHTLSLIALPMLKQLKETKHGSPLVDDADVPPELRHTLKKNPDDWETDDPWVHYKWEWVLNEMIFAHESIVDDSWEEKFHTDSGFDLEGFKQYNKRIENGLRLFGTYYRNLWD